MKTTSALLIAFVASFCLIIYMPLASYLANVNEFAFGGYDLFKQLLPLFFSSLALLFILARICKNILPTRLVPLGKHEICISPFDVFLVFLLLCIWLEGSLLSKGLPTLDGGVKLFTSTPRMFVDSALWILLVTVPLYLWKKSAAKIVHLTLGLCILMAVGIGERSAKKDDKLPVQLTQREVLENLRFHSSNNIIIIMADSVPLDVAKTVLEKNSDLANNFSDFIFFDNVLGAATDTMFAFPSMLLGEIYQGGDYVDFVASALESPSSLLQIFKNLGYNLYISSTSSHFNTVWVNPNVISGNTPAVEENLSHKPVITFPLYYLLSFSFSPYFVKYLTEDYLTDFVFNLEQNDETVKFGQAVTSDKNIYEKYLLPALNTTFSGNPTIHLHHLVGSHTPFRFRKDGSMLPASEAVTLNGLHEQTEWTLNMFSGLLDELRRKELYEDATVILIADHGDNLFRKIGSLNSRETPVFMIKPAAHKGKKLAFSDIPVSNTDIVRLLLSTHVDGRGGNLDSFSTVVSGRQRSLFIAPDTLIVVQAEGSLEKLTTKKIKTSTEPTVLIPAKDYVTTLEQGMNLDSTFAYPEKIVDPAILKPFGYWVQTKRKSEFYFKVAAKQQFINVELGLFYYGAGGKPKIPWEMRVADANTDKMLFSMDLNPQKTGQFTIKLENVSVKDGTIGINFLKGYPGFQEFYVNSIKVF